MMIWTIHLGAGNFFSYPEEQLFMTDVHTQGNLWLYAVTSEMSFTYEET